MKLWHGIWFGNFAGAAAWGGLWRGTDWGFRATVALVHPFIANYWKCSRTIFPRD